MNKVGCIVLTVLAVGLIIFGGFIMWKLGPHITDRNGAEALDALRFDCSVTSAYNASEDHKRRDEIMASFVMPPGLTMIESRKYSSGPNYVRWYRFNAEPENIKAIAQAIGAVDTGIVGIYQGSEGSPLPVGALVLQQLKMWDGDTAPRWVSSQRLDAIEQQPAWWTPGALVGCEAYFVEPSRGDIFAPLLYNRATRQGYFMFISS